MDLTGPSLLPNELEHNSVSNDLMEWNSNQSYIEFATELLEKRIGIERENKKQKRHWREKTYEIEPRDDKAGREFLGACSSVLVRKECV